MKSPWLLVISRPIPKFIGFGITVNGAYNRFRTVPKRQLHGRRRHGQENLGWWRRFLKPILGIASHQNKNQVPDRWPMPWTVHAWDYRRYVLASLPETLQSERRNHNELAYTTRKIEANFSNFSAWHHRTKLLKQVWETESEPVIKQMKEQGMIFAQWVDSNHTVLPTHRCRIWSGYAGTLDWPCGSVCLVISPLAGRQWRVLVPISGYADQVLKPQTGSDIITLKREIEQIQDLLGAEPRSKCTPYYCEWLGARDWLLVAAVQS